MVGIELGQEMKRSEILVLRFQFAVLIRKSYHEIVRYRFLNNLQICGKAIALLTSYELCLKTPLKFQDKKQYNVARLFVEL